MKKINVLVSLICFGLVIVVKFEKGAKDPTVLFVFADWKRLPL